MRIGAPSICFYILWMGYFILLLTRLITRLIWKFLLSGAIKIYIVDAKKTKLLLVCIVCFIFFFYGGWTINRHWLPGRFHPISLLGDIGILLFTILLGWVLTKIRWKTLFSKLISAKLLGWVLTKIRWKTLFNKLISAKYKRSRKIAFALISFLILFNLGIFIDSKINALKGLNVIFICIDALRADHLGCYGYNRKTSPFIDQIAKDGVMFTNAMSQSSYTKTSTEP